MKIRILIIDDEPRWINFVTQEFKESFEIVVARSDDEAIKRLGENKFTLVIASARWLKMLEGMGDQYSGKYSDKTVVVTVTPSIQEALKAYNLGAALYIPKSFSPNDFVAQIQDVIPKKS
jgi:DNA-binding response OmpR family regulator